MYILQKHRRKTQVYYGESSRPLCIRLREHTSSVVKKNMVSALAVHAVDNGHSMNFEGTTIVYIERVTWKRKYKEGMIINNSINYKLDVLKVSTLYTCLLDKIRKINEF